MPVVSCHGTLIFKAMKSDMQAPGSRPFQANKMTVEDRLVFFDRLCQQDVQENRTEPIELSMETLRSQTQENSLAEAAAMTA